MTTVASVAVAGAGEELKREWNEINSLGQLQALQIDPGAWSEK